MYTEHHTVYHDLFCVHVKNTILTVNGNRRVILLSKDVDVGSELLERRMDNHLFYCDFLRSNFSELVYKRGGQFHTSPANRRMS